MSKFDDKIKEKLYNYESEIPDHIWSSVKKEIQPERKSYFLFWFFSFIFLFLGGSMFWYLSRPDKEKQFLQLLPQTTSEAKLSGQIVNQSDPNDASAASIKPTIPSDKISEEKTIQKITKQNSDQNSSINRYEATELNKKDKHKSRNENVEVLMSADLVKTKMQVINSDLTPDSDIIYHDQTSEELNSEIINTNKVKDKIALPLAFNKNRLSDDGPRKMINATSLLPHQRLVLGMDQSDKFEEIFKSMKKHASLACPTFIKKQNLTFAEVYFSNVFAHKSLKQNRGEDETYLNLRKQTENNHLSYAVGARLGIGWESGIAFKSGFDITQVNEKFEYTDPKSIQKKIITVVKYIYDDKFNIIDSTKTTEEIEIPGTNRIVNKNSYTFIDLPILFQYTIPGTRRLSYSISVGPYINIAIARSGKILDSRINNHNVRSLVNLKDAEYFKNNIGLSFHGSVGINYQLTNTIQIVIEPSIRMMPTSMTKLTYALNQNYLFTNISAGLKYKI